MLYLIVLDICYHYLLGNLACAGKQLLSELVDAVMQAKLASYN